MNSMHSYLSAAASIAIEAGRISENISNQILEKTREVGVPGNLYESCEERQETISNQLDSKFDKEKIEALKRLIAVIDIF
jgi:AP-3 complex subunit beta